MVLSGQAFHFGPFSLYPASRLLLEDGRPVRIGARALDLLIALVERSGQVITKEELFRRVWPDTIVEETSLRVHIAALRKVLGGPDARYITNIPGKGYSFNGSAAVGQSTLPPAAAPRKPPPGHNLPIRLTRMVGRSATSDGIATALLTHRFVTITGEGGVGKTTLALAVAEQNLHEYTDGVVFVDLASCTAPSLIVSTVGRALGLILPSHSPDQLLCDALRDLRFLLIVDNCEHLVVHATELVCRLLAQLPALRILATSREALRADGEYVHRLETLPVPPAGDTITAEAALRYESIQLLVERVAAANDGFVLNDADAPYAAELCRRLDGIPLAIELAAARVSFFGLQGLVSRLHDRLQILTAGHRTVMPRHRTLRALYDWSYDLLGERARCAYARLAVFPASFSLDAALALMPCAERAAALPMFLDLIAKSLVAVDLQGDSRRYRLLDTARVYAMEKLASLGELADARHAHAQWLRQALLDANEQWDHAGRRTWLARHGPLTEDVCALLDWMHGDAPSALPYARLLEAAYLLFQELSQLEVLRPHLEDALAGLRAAAERHPELERRLAVLAGQAIAHGLPREMDARKWFRDADASLSAPDAPPDILHVATAMQLQHADYRSMLRLAERLELAGEYAGDVESMVAARSFQAVAHHHLGHFNTSRQLAERALLRPRPTRRSGMPFDNVDRRVSLGIVLARATWIQGDTPDAWRQLEALAEQVEQEVERFQCEFLATTAVPICLWSGRRERAAAYLAQLQQLVARPHLGEFWAVWAEAFARVLEGRVPAPRAPTAMLLDVLGTVAPDFESEAMLARAHSGVAGWAAPEVLRHQGERLKRQAPEEAERLFRKALERAHEQGAVRWELRAALSLARLSLAHGLAPVQEQMLLTPLARLLADAGSDPDATEASELVDRLVLLRRRATP